MDTYSADGGAGVPPLTMSKDEDGTIYVAPLFSGIRLTRAAAKKLAAYLIAAHKPDATETDETVDLTKDGE